MSNYLMIGPFPPPIGGPTVKNDVLFKELTKHVSIRKIDTSQWKKNKIRLLFKIVFSKEKKVILAVSKNGRLLLAILRFKKFVYIHFQYSLIPMGDGLNKELTGSRWLNRKLLHFGLKKTKSILIQTKKQYRELKEKFPHLPIHYIPSFKNKPHINFEYRLEKKIFKIVYVSTVKFEKGILTLIKAVSKIKTPVKLDIYGPIENSFKSLLDQKIQNYLNIDYCGVIDPQKVSKIINEYQLFVFPTFWPTEGFSNVLIDAMIASVPIVASDWNYNSEVIKKGRNGLLFQPNNENDLLKKINVLIKNKNDRLIYAKNNKTDVKKYYIENMVYKILSYID